MTERENGAPRPELLWDQNLITTLEKKWGERLYYPTNIAELGLEHFGVGRVEVAYFQKGHTHKDELAESIGEVYFNHLCSILKTQGEPGLLTKRVPRVSVISSGHMAIALARTFQRRGLPGPKILMDEAHRNLPYQQKLIGQVEELGGEVYYMNLGARALSREDILRHTDNQAPDALELTSQTLAADIAELNQSILTYRRIEDAVERNDVEELRKIDMILPLQRQYTLKGQRSSSMLIENSNLSTAGYMNIGNDIARLLSNKTKQLPRTIVVPFGSGHLFETFLYWILLVSERNMYEGGEPDLAENFHISKNLDNFVGRRRVKGYKTTIFAHSQEAATRPWPRNRLAVQLLAACPTRTSQQTTFLSAGTVPFIQETLRECGAIKRSGLIENYPQIRSISDATVRKVMEHLQWAYGSESFPITPEFSYAVAAAIKYRKKHPEWKQDKEATVVVNTGAA